MKSLYLFPLSLIITLFSLNVYSQNATYSCAESKGNALLPVPQKVSLSDQHYLLDDSWTIEIVENLSINDPAVVSLTSELKERFGLKLKGPGRSGSHKIQLTVKLGSVNIGHTTDT